MKVVLYLLMFLLLEPILRVAGVAMAGMFLAFMVALGVYLLVRRTDRAQSGPDEGSAAPQVYVVTQPCCSGHVDRDAAAGHPARRNWFDDQAPSWVWGERS
ncbi:hypothetical protein KL864_16805 [Mycolicibacterium goodii]|uniref:hypothetical protein n=1 Tax=Mycolicibacterium goodii TaxID=134601 RepID=UPI0011151A24|nr:hypothetical protein [Mycolicibacterium goodii]MBU8817563.1 hypothetical protein [Mycolicibacterium goodii]